MTRALLLFALAACKDTGSGMMMSPDAPPGQTSCDTNAMCDADEYCAASKKCEPVLELRGFTASVESFQCQPPGQTVRQCAAYRTSFVLHDHSTTELVMRLEDLAIASGEFEVSSSIRCASAPWMIPANSMSGVLDVVFDYRGGPDDGGWPAWAVPCGANSLTPEIIDDIGPGPTTGDFAITASLRLSDGTLVEVRATAPLTPF